MANTFQVKTISFQEIAKNDDGRGDQVLADIETIAQALLYRKSSKNKNFLRDEVDYQRFLQAPFITKTNFGHVFLLYEASTKPVGFLIALCNHQFVKKNSKKAHRGATFPFDHCGIWFSHDIPYLKDLNTLGTFAFCFQLGVLKKYQKDYSCGSELLDSFEQFYCGEKHSSALKTKCDTLLLAASIHENQYQVIKLLEKRNKPEFINRHAQRMPGLDFKVLFLDHYFDSKLDKGHWFRVIQIPDTQAFSKQINYQNILEAFSTIIPIQLNQAVSQINRVIAPLGAELTWSSFFHDNLIFEEKYQLPRENNGFFLSLLQADEASYFELLDEAGEIMDYLQKKRQNVGEVASLTRAFDKSTAEVFFFNGKIPQMKSFVNPILLDITDEEVAYQQIMDFAIQQEIVKNRLPKEESNSWYNAFLDDLKHSTPATRKLKAYFVDRLHISQNEIDILEQGIINRNKSQLPERVARRAYRDPAFRRIVNRINTEQPAISVQDSWRKYIRLHRKLWKIDAAAWKEGESYCWCHAIIPINYSPISKTLGVMFSFYCRPGHSANKKTEQHERMDAVAHLISAALPRYLLNNVMKIQENDSIELATRYGIAAVTTRNMAHHIGSHVLAHTSNPATIAKFKNETFYDDFDEQLARFHEYLRVKTHLLADMISSNPVSSVSRWLNGEIITHFNQQDILTRFVSGTHIQMVDVQFRDRFNQFIEDILVQVPNGDLGVHALFMIITNMIRNAAKYEHEYTKDMDELTITARVVPTLDERSKNAIADDNPSLCTDHPSNRGYEILLYDNVARDRKNLDELIKRLNDKLRSHSSRLGKNIRASGWGLLEMSAAAAYLRKKSVDVTKSMGTQKVDIPLIKAESYMLRTYEEIDEKGHPQQKSDYSLAYRIYLKKPRLALIINFDEEERLPPPSWALEHGLRYTSVSELNTWQQKDSFTHHFALAFSPKTRKSVEVSKRFPLRWVDVSTTEQREELRQVFEQPDGKKFNTWIWQYWMARYLHNKRLDPEQLQLWLPGDSDLKQSDTAKVICFDLHNKVKHAAPDRVFHFHQQYGSVCPTGRILANISNYDPYERQVLRAKLMEAAVTEVIVLDERIQRQSLEIGGGKSSHIERLRRMNIYLPNPLKGEPDLYQEDNPTRVNEWLSEKLVGTPLDFVIIHLGLLETWLDSDITEIQDWIDTQVVAKNNRVEIILISGRGRHIKFPATYLYQPVSTISEFIVSNMPSKLHFTQILFSSRTRLTI